MNINLYSRKTRDNRAQAMVEFAIVAPILFLMLIGIFEVGRMIFLYSAVTNASREAVRYGSAIGYDDIDQELKYRNCARIREVARKASYFATIPDSNITITYDHGPGTSVFHTCTGTVDPGYFVNSGDRILVSVTGTYTPFTSLIPWGSRDFVAASARTILGYVAIAPAGGGGGGPGGGGPGGPTATPTETMDPYNPWTDTPTATEVPYTDTPTNTPTSTNTPGAVYTFTPTPTSTSTGVPTSTPTPTNTPTVTPTPTNTPTATPTYTPTSTSTPVSGCNQITTGDITMSNNSAVISMTITNPHSDFTVTSVQFKWDTGNGSNKKALTIAQLSGVQFWTGSNNSGNITITPSSTLTLPGNNTQSTVQFTLDQKYGNPGTNLTTITLNLSSSACNSVTVTKTK
jgi:Flp pilus assembly protein TadG